MAPPLNDLPIAAAGIRMKNSSVPPAPCSLPSKGFTLLEVLAAIALLAFAFAIGLRAMSGALHNTARGTAITAATLEAQSLLDAQGLATPLRNGVQQGSFADGSAWRLQTRAFVPPVPRGDAGAGQAAQAPNGGIALFRLDLDVRYDATRTLHFSTLRAQTAQTPQNTDTQ